MVSHSRPHSTRSNTWIIVLACRTQESGHTEECDTGNVMREPGLTDACQNMSLYMSAAAWDRSAQSLFPCLFAFSLKITAVGGITTWVNITRQLHVRKRTLYT